MRNDKDDLLQTWKEISAYLDCDSRTCARWEKELGLPVYRFKGMGKSRVFAYRSEIDAWREKRAHSRPQENRSEHSRRRKGMKTYYVVLAAAAVVITTVLFFLPRSSRNPADFRIDGSELVIVNDEGRELWRYDTEKKNLVDEEAYEKRSQYRKTGRAPLQVNKVFLPHIMIADLNGDAVHEVLFSVQTQDEFGEGELLCFDASGTELWRFQAGMKLFFGSDPYSGDYRISGFMIDDLDFDGNIEIVVIADHKYYFPTRLSVLDAKGEVKGDFWNSGRLVDLRFVDLNGDGKKEILAAGMNNECKCPVLVVFDAGRIEGASPQEKDEYTCSACKPGTEMYYLRFPRTDVDRLDFLMDCIWRIDIFKNGRVSLMTHQSNIFYELDYDIKPVDVRLSNSFEQAHRKAVGEGLISSELDDAYKKALLESVRYFDGINWVSEPSVNQLYHSE